MKRTSIIISVLLVLVFALSSCTSAPSAPVNVDTSNNSVIEAGSGGNLRRAVVSDPRNLNPIFADDMASIGIIAHIFSPLLTMDENGNLIPEIAAEMPTISADNKNITFKLKAGTKWHDGVEVTAEDIKFSYELILDEEVNSPRKGYFEAVSSIETPDKYTVVFNLSKPDSQILSYFSSPYILPKHIIEKMDKKQLKEGDFSRNPIGNGPFKFVEWITSERVVLAANIDYFEGKPALDQITYQIVPSSATSLVKLETEEIDLASVPETDVARLKTKDFLNVISYASSGFDCIQYNTKANLFSDKKVRQAISYSINVEAIIKGIYKGNATKAYTSYAPGLWFTKPDVKKYDFNIVEANRLLDEAGWKMGSDGIREKAGVKFEFNLLTNKGNVAREKMVVYMQSALKDVGIKANPKIIEWNTLFDKYVDPGNFDAYVGAYNSGLDMIHNYYTLDDYFNAGKYDNPKIAELYDKVRATFDKEEQKTYLYEVQDILAEDQPFTYITFGKANVATNKKVKNVKYVDLQGQFDIEKWFIKE